ncbi:uncharacterized protein LOC118356048 isoform X2 [Zalophus californianus]|uniref:Uncharacterized protein LOC118356048 isoform X2 n=1 Tax=Zalophus californianus TaxID=9704 RepID=A0A6P9EZ34_ZALCA|nr:uncharacterized protein LOC118356048 isoform X2 [Zalophus californianus]
MWDHIHADRIISGGHGAASARTGARPPQAPPWEEKILKKALCPAYVDHQHATCSCHGRDHSASPHCTEEESEAQRGEKSMDDMERWLVDTPSISWTEGLTPQGSLGAGAGDCQRRPPTPPRPLSQVVVHRTVVQELEPTEAEPEAAPPPEELEPAPTPSTALEGRGSDCSDFRRRPGAGR